MEFLEGGKFSVGCNYWASNAGVDMWKKWDPAAVDADFKKLSSHNIRLLRVFPLWPDFQPVRALYGVNGELKEYRMGEMPLPDTPMGQAGVSEEAMEKFAQFLSIGKKYNIRFVVSLITGWMSGRLFVPEALQGLNCIKDPRAVMWQVRFVRTFVQYFCDDESILAWDLGNECNCLAQFSTAEELYSWTSSISGAVRMQDSRRPILSGMHGLLPEGKWNIRQQAELTDFLTTHPYPLFTPWCDAAPLNTMRTELHGTAETIFYRGIGHKPCFVEETGTLGPVMGDAETAAAFLRTCLFSLWAHDCRGLLWWCANEQSHLTNAPYDWCAAERELGLFDRDGAPKPVLTELEEFSYFIRSFGLSFLPDRIVDGICILTKGQDCWANAYMSFVLAKQAGLDLEFAYSDQKIPEASMYLMPGICGDTSISLYRMKELLERVNNGAFLYISFDTGIISGFEKLSGTKSKGREKAERVSDVTFTTEDGTFTLPIRITYLLKLKTENSKVLARDENGNPIGVLSQYGKGHILMLTAPLEMTAAMADGCIEQGPEYYHVYQLFRQYFHSSKAAAADSPSVGLTEHRIDERHRILILINYAPDPVSVRLSLSAGWRISRLLRGNLDIPGNDCSVLEIGL